MRDENDQYKSLTQNFSLRLCHNLTQENTNMKPFKPTASKCAHFEVSYPVCLLSSSKLPKTSSGQKKEKCGNFQHNKVSL